MFLGIAGGTQQMSKHVTALTLAMLLGTNVAGQAQDRVDKNLKIMLQAARSLKFTDENRAYILIKRTGSLMSDVGVIWGYGDNRLACRDIAEAMTPKSSGRTWSYECHAVY
jgi:hypothetical protein